MWNPMIWGSRSYKNHPVELHGSRPDINALPSVDGEDSDYEVWHECFPFSSVEIWVVR